MAAYLQIGDIKGEATDKNHKDWIEVLSVSQGVSRPMSAGTSNATSQRNRSAATLGDIVCVKVVDASSAKLAEAVCDGKNFDTVKLDICTSVGDDSRKPYFQWELKNVFITHYDISGSTTDSAAPTETISLNYAQIRWIYDKIGKDGKSQGKVEAGWDVHEAKKM